MTISNTINRNPSSTFQPTATASNAEETTGLARTARSRSSSQDVFVRTKPSKGSNPNVGPRSALQKHTDFFDYNGDGKINLPETYRGLRDLGFGIASSGTVAPLINIGLGRATGGSLFTVDANNIHKGKHGGDSGAFDTSGRHIKKNAQIVKDNDKNGDKRLSYGELWGMINAKNAGAKNTGAAAGEWMLLNFLAGEKSGQSGEKSIDQATVDQFYDGSLFYEVAERTAAKRAERDKTTLGRVGGFIAESF